MINVLIAKNTMCLFIKNEEREIKLETLELPNGRADSVVKGITVLDEYILWNFVVMVVADTTSVKTNGIVIQLKRLFAREGLKEQQFIGCQHVDRVLRIVMDNEFREKSHLPILKIHLSQRL